VNFHISYDGAASKMGFVPNINCEWGDSGGEREREREREEGNTNLKYEVPHLLNIYYTLKMNMLIKYPAMKT